MNADTRELVERYWATMNRNDFWAVGDLLHDDFVLDYPQSGERIRGRENNSRLNAEYPSAGPWQFTVGRTLVDGDQATTDVRVRGAELDARVISFFEVRDGLIWRMTEYWPDPFDPPADRAHLVERVP